MNLRSTTLALVFGTMPAPTTGREGRPENIDADAVQCPFGDDIMHLSGDERSGSISGGSEGDGRDVSEEVEGEVKMHQEHGHQTQSTHESFHGVLSHDEMRRNMLRRQVTCAICLFVGKRRDCLHSTHFVLLVVNAAPRLSDGGMEENRRPGGEGCGASMGRTR